MRDVLTGRPADMLSRAFDELYRVASEPKLFVQGGTAIVPMPVP